MAMELKMTGLTSFVKEEEITNMNPLIQTCNKMLLEKTGPGNDFLGWVNLPLEYDKEEFARIQAAAKKIQKQSDVLVVIGIGGSYLGARAAIEFVKGQMYNAVREEGIPSALHRSTISSRSSVTVISLSMSFPSPARPQSRLSHSASLRHWLKRSMARKAQRTASMLPPTRHAVP